MQTATAINYLPKLGHDIAVHGIYGLQGAKLIYNGIPVYPNNAGDFGVKESPGFYQDFGADILLSLYDVWVLGDLDPAMNWVPWLPIDHDPPPPKVIKVLKNQAGLVKPIAMSKFGQRKLAENGIDAYYIPHSVDTTLFSPNPVQRETARAQVGWSNKFVIGTVGTNHAERKNWTTGMKAVAMFEKMHPGEVIYYAHTEPVHQRGINILTLRAALGLEGIMCFPSQSAMSIGMSQEDMARVYNAMDVHLLPTKGEGFGIPIMESQACGVPNIITKCTGHEELMGGGWFIEDLSTMWESYQDSFQFNCTPEEIVERLEQAYQAKKDGSIEEECKKARAKALEYDDGLIYSEMWRTTLNDIEQLLSKPRNREGVQVWRANLIPSQCTPRKVLDLGCGVTQPYRELLSDLGEYVGVDLREGEGVTVLDARDLPYADQEFGFVWCSEMLEHADDPERIVAEAKRVGKHGAIIFTTPQKGDFRLDPDHKIVDPSLGYTLTNAGDGLILW